MALRESAKKAGDKIDLQVVLGKNADQSGIANARTLVAFVEAFISRDEAALDVARKILVDEMGAAAMVDAAAVAANFQRMVRIADAIGIPVDEQMNMITKDIQKQLELRQFPSSHNTPE